MGEEITLTPLDEAYAKGFADGQDAVKGYAGDALSDANQTIDAYKKALDEAERALKEADADFADLSIITGKPERLPIVTQALASIAALKTEAILTQLTQSAQDMGMYDVTNEKRVG